MQKLKVDDNVIVLKGKDSGKEGRLVLVDYDKSRCIVEGINVCKIHVKKSDNDEGGIKEVERPIHLSNVALKDSKSSKPTRVRIQVKGKDKKRISVKSNAEIK